MPRTRTEIVKESQQELAQMVSSVSTDSDRARMLMLRLLKENPSLRLEDVAIRIGRSLPTVKRWWGEYRRGGVAALVTLQSKPSAKRPDANLAILQEKLLGDEFKDINDVQRWIDSVVGEPVPIAYAYKAEPTEEDTFERLIEFLNSLPDTGDINQWAEGFRNAMYELLPDVDHMSVVISTACRLHAPQTYKPGLSVFNLYATKPISLTLTEYHKNRVQHFIDELRSAGFAFNKFHAPHGFEFYCADTAYLGALIFWREINKPPISQDTLRLMQRLQKFMVHLFTNAVARANYAKPLDRAISDAITFLPSELWLTPQQHKILNLQLLGYSIEEMAQALHITTHTVRSHINAIYAKAGVHSFSELIGRYMMIRGVSPKDQKKDQS